MSAVEVKKLREELGLEPNALLTSPSGLLADILDVNGNDVTIGILATGRVVTQPRSNFYSKRPEEAKC